MKNPVTVSELLHLVEQLNTHELKDFFLKVQVLHAKKVASDTDFEEQKLLKLIKTPWLSSKQLRFDYLIIRRNARTITEQEFAELTKLENEIGRNDGIRLKRIAKLADLKGLSLSEVIRLYNLQTILHG